MATVLKVLVADAPSRANGSNGQPRRLWILGTPPSWSERPQRAAATVVGHVAAAHEATTDNKGWRRRW